MLKFFRKIKNIVFKKKNVLKQSAEKDIIKIVRKYDQPIDMDFIEIVRQAINKSISEKITFVYRQDPFTHILKYVPKHILADGTTLLPYWILVCQNGPIEHEIYGSHITNFKCEQLVDMETIDGVLYNTFGEWFMNSLFSAGPAGIGIYNPQHSYQPSSARWPFPSFGQGPMFSHQPLSNYGFGNRYSEAKK